jgi:hypothetical protein
VQYKQYNEGESVLFQSDNTLQNSNLDRADNKGMHNNGSPDKSASFFDYEDIVPLEESAVRGDSQEDIQFDQNEGTLMHPGDKILMEPEDFMYKVQLKRQLYADMVDAKSCP